jgi:hypothetical protein
MGKQRRLLVRNKEKNKEDEARLKVRRRLYPHFMRSQKRTGV